MAANQVQTDYIAKIDAEVMSLTSQKGSIDSQIGGLQSTSDTLGARLTDLAAMRAVIVASEDGDEG